MKRHRYDGLVTIAAPDFDPCHRKGATEKFIVMQVLYLMNQLLILSFG